MDGFQRYVGNLAGRDRRDNTTVHATAAFDLDASDHKRNRNRKLPGFCLQLAGGVVSSWLLGFCSRLAGHDLCSRLPGFCSRFAGCVVCSWLLGSRLAGHDLCSRLPGICS